MNIGAIILLSLCIVIPFVALIAFGLSTNKAKVRYGNYTNNLKEKGLYKSWASKNGYLLLISNLSIILSLLSFVGCMAISIIYKTDIGISITRFLFASFAFLMLVYVLSTSILYYQTPKDSNKSK